MDLDVLTGVLRVVFFTFIVISAFLLVGAFLRARFQLFQRLFLPASVIGGFIGLILGPIVLKDYAVLPFPEDWITIASLLPGLLIVPVVASVPLGMRFGSRKKTGRKKSSGTRNVFIMFFVLGSVLAAQNFYGVFVAGTFKSFFNFDEIYATFGTELAAGFAGGHGTAGVVGNLLQSMGQPFWNTAQGVTTTTATVGIVSGILIGIVFINIAARKGLTSFIKSGTSIPEDVRTGIQRDVSKQKAIGKETTNAASIDSLGFHLALILVVSGLAFVATYFFEKYDILILNLIPEWAYAIVFMYGVWALMIKFDLAWIVDVETKTKVASSLTEFAIVAAIISLPLQAVFTLILPIVVMVTGGLIITFGLAYYLSKKFFTDYWVERSVTVLGTNTGVFLTGLLLLTMVDPDMKSPVLRDYSFSYSINSIISFVLFPLSFGVLINYGFLSGLALYAFVFIIFISLLLIMRRKNKQEGIV